MICRRSRDELGTKWASYRVPKLLIVTPCPFSFYLNVAFVKRMDLFPPISLRQKRSAHPGSCRRFCFYASPCWKPCLLHQKQQNLMYPVTIYGSFSLTHSFTLKPYLESAFCSFTVSLSMAQSSMRQAGTEGWARCGSWLGGPSKAPGKADLMSKGSGAPECSWAKSMSP